MKKSLLITSSLFILMSLIAGGCRQVPKGTDFNFIFKYGVGARNTLDTFKGTYSKDMVIGFPAQKNLTLSEEEMAQIYQKMVEIEFFNYPNEFKVAVAPDGITGMVTPYSSYYFKVQYESGIKELKWDDEITNPNEKATQLRELVTLIRNIIESKDEYKKLPQPKGGYL
jgi:hypothetical protein